MDITIGGFHKKLKNDIRVVCFLKMDVFWTKYGHESNACQVNERFLTKCEHESIDFFVKNGKKNRHPIEFFVP